MVYKAFAFEGPLLAPFFILIFQLYFEYETKPSYLLNSLMVRIIYIRKSLRKQLGDFKQ